MNVSYETAQKNQMVHDIVYSWLKSTKATHKFDILRDWQRGKIYLVIDPMTLRRPLHHGHDRPYQSAYLKAQFLKGF